MMSYTFFPNPIDHMKALSICTSMTVPDPKHLTISVFFLYVARFTLRQLCCDTALDRFLSCPSS